MKKLIEKRAELKAKLKALLDGAKTENRGFTPEETAEFDRIENEIKSLDSTIKAEERAKNISDIQPEKQSDRAEIEKRAFADYIKGKITEMRAGEQNIDIGNNGAVIPQSIANKIIDEVKDICPILAGADIYYSKGTLKIPKWTKANSTHDITTGYASEFTELTADSGKFVSVDLNGFLCGSLVLVGKSVINNSAVNLTDFVIRKVSEKISQFIEKELLTGTGTNSAQGALNTSNIVTGASSTAITFDELIDLQSAVKQVYQKNACWTMNPKTFNAIKKLKDTTGRVLIEPDASKPFPYILLGKPVYVSDNMPEIEAGAKTVLYGDYSGLSVNFRESISIEMLREKYATQHAVGVCAWYEFDSRITDEQKLAVFVQKDS